MQAASCFRGLHAHLLALIFNLRRLSHSFPFHRLCSTAQVTSEYNISARPALLFLKLPSPSLRFPNCPPPSLPWGLSPDISERNASSVDFDALHRLIAGGHDRRRHRVYCWLRIWSMSGTAHGTGVRLEP